MSNGNTQQARPEPRTSASAGTSSSTSSPSGGGRGVQMKTLVGGADGFDAQQAMVTPVQRHGSGRETEGVHQAAAQGIAGGGGAVPHLSAIQQSFGGVDVSGVKAHTDAKAGEASRAMGASAYATGNDVAFDGAPDLHTAAPVPPVSSGSADLPATTASAT